VIAIPTTEHWSFNKNSPRYETKQDTSVKVHFFSNVEVISIPSCSQSLGPAEAPEHRQDRQQGKQKTQSRRRQGQKKPKAPFFTFQNLSVQELVLKTIFFWVQSPYYWHFL